MCRYSENQRTWVRISAGQRPLQLALASNWGAAACALLGAGPAPAALAAIADAGPPALPLFTDFLLAPGRLPLAAADWARVPSPCHGAERALPTALACSSAQAAQRALRLPPADSDRVRLRTAALCLSRVGLPSAVAALILAHCI